MSEVKEMLAIDIDTGLVGCYFYFDLESFPLIKREVRDLPLLVLPTSAVPAISDDCILTLSGINVQGDIVTAVLIVFL